MRKLRAWIVISVLAVLGVAGGLTFAETSPSPWVSPANPTLRKIVDLPDGITPSQNNIDCDPITTRMAYSRLMQEDCVMPTSYGLAGNNGIIFTGASELVPITTSPPFVGLIPIPNQGLYYTYSSASTFGSYMGFFRTIRDKMKPLPDLINGGYQYPLTKGPDFILKNLAGNSQPVNNQSVAFSPNGNWMVIDFPFQGYVRVNLATFEIMPFTLSMNNGNDYANYTAQLTISNDGRYVAMKPGSGGVFVVYDVASCVKAVLPYDQAQAQCQSRNYWPELSAQFPGLRAIYQPRFTSSMQLSVLAQYGSSGSKFSQYSLTAPGENPTGIEYLGMGDSFASGQGAFNYIAGTDTSNNGCHQSSLSYPYLLSARLFNSGHSIACSGAETKDIFSPKQTYKGQNFPHHTEDELARLKSIDSILANYTPGYLLQSDFVDTYNPQNITLSIGGNDIGFQDVIQRCIKNDTCYPTKEDQQELADSILNSQGKLQSTYHSLKSPARNVYVIGYPQIVVSGGNCANNVHLNENEIKMFVDLTNLINQTIQQAAAREGVQYVDVSNALAGHRMCEVGSANVAVNGLTAGTDLGLGFVKIVGAESYHPNVLGHELLAQAILGQTNGFKSYQKASSVAITPAFPYTSSPASGRATNLLVHTEDLAPRLLAPQSSPVIHADGSSIQLKTAAPYSVKLDTSPTPIASGTTDSTGVLNTTAPLPADTSCGSHTLHVYSQNIAGQPVDIYKEIYVAPSNGCGAAGSTCGVVADIGVDADKDGIDDACDPRISDAPPPPAGQSVYLTGSSIHIGQTAPPVSQPVSIAAEPIGFHSSAPPTVQKTRQTAKNYLVLAASATSLVTAEYVYLRRNRYQIK